MKWQTIESSPKTERYPTMILGYAPHDSGGYMCVVFWNEPRNAFLNNLDGEIEPVTHWMPLPEPPKSTAQKCPKCGSSSQIWINQITKKLTCHRAYCHTEI